MLCSRLSEGIEADWRLSLLLGAYLVLRISARFFMYHATDKLVSKRFHLMAFEGMLFAIMKISLYVRQGGSRRRQNQCCPVEVATTSLSVGFNISRQGARRHRRISISIFYS